MNSISTSFLLVSYIEYYKPSLLINLDKCVKLILQKKGPKPKL